MCSGLGVPALANTITLMAVRCTLFFYIDGVAQCAVPTSQEVSLHKKSKHPLKFHTDVEFTSLSFPGFLVCMPAYVEQQSGLRLATAFLVCR